MTPSHWHRWSRRDYVRKGQVLQPHLFLGKPCTNADVLDVQRAWGKWPLSPRWSWSWRSRWGWVGLAWGETPAALSWSQILHLMGLKLERRGVECRRQTFRQHWMSWNVRNVQTLRRTGESVWWQRPPALPPSCLQWCSWLGSPVADHYLRRIRRRLEWEGLQTSGARIAVLILTT